jgi:hypothetical protein
VYSREWILFCQIYLSAVVFCIFCFSFLIYNKFVPLGGCDATLKAAQETDLLQTLAENTTKYDYDILVKKTFFQCCYGYELDGG